MSDKCECCEKMYGIERAKGYNEPPICLCQQCLLKVCNSCIRYVEGYYNRPQFRKFQINRFRVVCAHCILKTELNFIDSLSDHDLPMLINNEWIYGSSKNKFLERIASCKKGH